MALPLILHPDERLIKFRKGLANAEPSWEFLQAQDCRHGRETAHAPPGAGHRTRLPLAQLHHVWMDGAKYKSGMMEGPTNMSREDDSATKDPETACGNLSAAGLRKDYGVSGPVNILGRANTIARDS